MSGLFFLHLTIWQISRAIKEWLRPCTKSSMSPESRQIQISKLPSRRLESSPQPRWTPAMKSQHPFVVVRDNTTKDSTSASEYRTLDPSTISSSYAMLVSCVVPRPIAFVSTISPDGIGNLAPFSYFGIAAHNPPTVSVGVCYNRNGTKKDTLANAEATREFVVNIVGNWMVEACNHTSFAFPSSIDELVQANLTSLPSEVVRPVRVAESAVQLECVLTGVHDVTDDTGAVTSSVIFGRVVRFHVLAPLYEESTSGPRVRFEGYRPVSRLGGDLWADVGDYYNLPRPFL